MEEILSSLTGRRVCLLLGTDRALYGLLVKMDSDHGWLAFHEDGQLSLTYIRIQAINFIREQREGA